ncbi:MAG: hypothetical protein HQK50_14780 [Oligoflexia bacterium]|nr:hypothetical protein [Oligoflexia bacterium]MBF0366836.1 hypothetical protein [Oligoflexia bacterium]
MRHTPLASAVLPKAQVYEILFLFSFFLLLLLSLSSRTGYATTAFAPTLASDDDKISFLFYLRKEIPNLFSEATTYNVNLLQLLEQQNNLLDKLTKDDLYKKLAAERGDAQQLSSIYLKKVATIHQEISKVDPVLFKERKDDLKQFLQNHPPLSAQNLDSYFDTMIATASAKISGDPEGNWWGNLLKRHPRYQKDPQAFSQVMRFPLEERIRILDEELLAGRSFQEVFPGFSLANQGFKKSDESQLIHTLKQSVDALKILEQLFALKIIFKEFADADADELLPALDYVNESHLSAFNDRELLKELTNSYGVFKKFNLSSRLQKKYSELIPKKTETVESVSGKQLILKEVPPAVALFRGFVGNDCSSGKSGMYANSPMERVFFLEDAKGRVKGYVAGTILTIEGTPSFYLHTIAGMHISPEDTQSVFEGLNELLHSKAATHPLLPAKQLALPDPSHLILLINSPAILEVFRTYAKDLPLKATSYIDSPLRDHYLDRLSTQSYDLTAFNKIAGVVPRPLHSSLYSIEIKPTSLPPFQANDRGDQLDRFLLALDFLRTNNSGTAKQMLGEFAPFTLEMAAKVNRILQNKERSAMGVYLDRVGKLLSPLGLQLQDALKRRPELFEEGQLRATDAMSDVYAKESTHLFLKLFKNKKFADLSSILKGTSEQFTSILSNESFKHQLMKFCHHLEWRSDPLELIAQLKDLETLFDLEIFQSKGIPLEEAKECLNKDISKVRSTLNDEGFTHYFLATTFAQKRPDAEALISEMLLQKEASKDLIRSVLTQDYWQKHPEYDHWIEQLLLSLKNNYELSSELVNSILSNPRWKGHPKWGEWVWSLIKNHQASHSIGSTIFANPKWQDDPQLIPWIEQLLEIGGEYEHAFLVRHVLSQAKWKDHPEWPQKIIQAKKVNYREIISHVLSKEHWKDHPEFVEQMIKQKNTLLDGEITCNPWDIESFILSTKHWADYFKRLLKTETTPTLDQIRAFYFRG